ncbi:hypothetical protein [Tumebacillus algifaecis]|nr:hypothetical protein [Tumebacillus algifaecis]
MAKQDWFDLDLQVVKVESKVQAMDPHSIWSNCDTCEELTVEPTTA